MVKVLRPPAKFSRCVDTAMAGITVAEAESVTNGNGDAWNADPAPHWRNEHEAPPPPVPARFAKDSLWKLKQHLLRRLELAELEKFYHEMQLSMASNRNETMRLYDQTVSAGGSQRRVSA